MERIEFEQLVDSFQAFALMDIPVMFGLYPDDAELKMQRPEFNEGIYITEREMLLGVLSDGHLEMYDFSNEPELVNQVLINQGIEFTRLNNTKIVFRVKTPELLAALKEQRDVRKEQILQRD